MQMSNTLLLDDGRQLGYAQYGLLTGYPVFYFTGGQSSRIDGKQFSSKAEALKIRLITVDRPGMGLSDFLPNRQFLDWPSDVAALADHLEIDTFSVFGLSGGGPHALACAYKLPDRVIRVGIVSGAAPFDMPNRSKNMWMPIKIMYFLASKFPKLHRQALNAQAKSLSDPEKFMKQMKMGLPEPDQVFLERDEESGKNFIQAGIEGYRNGIEGDAWEWQLYVSPWNFDLESIQQPAFLWFGAVDGMVPAAMGEYMHAKLPNSQLKIVPDGGHLSTIHNYINEILLRMIG